LKADERRRTRILKRLGLFKETGLRRGASTIKAAAGLALAWLLAGACACSSPAGPAGGAASSREGTQAPASGATAAPDGVSGSVLGFTLSNLTGSTFRAVYISPSDSAGWEENILGGDVLADGGALTVRFSPGEKATLWDLRVETMRRSAEWKGLDLRDASRVTLFLSQFGEKPFVAEIE
jgi:hypothetical protein